MLYLAWTENPGIAIQLAVRFPSARLRNDVRRLLLNSPEKALDEPSGLEIVFGLALPADVSFQLKVCLLSCSPFPFISLSLSVGVLSFTDNDLVFVVLGIYKSY